MSWHVLVATPREQNNVLNENENGTFRLALCCKYCTRDGHRQRQQSSPFPWLCARCGEIFCCPSVTAAGKLRSRVFRCRPPHAVQTVLTAVAIMLGLHEPTWAEVRRVSRNSSGPASDCDANVALGLAYDSILGINIDSPHLSHDVRFRVRRSVHFGLHHVVPFRGHSHSINCALLRTTAGTRSFTRYKVRGTNSV